MEALNPILNQVSIWVFIGLVLYAAWSDFREYLIPNHITVGLLVLYPAFILSSAQVIDWPYACVIAGGVFLVGTTLFAANLMGGGDVKLLTVCALWAGTELALPFLILTAFLGGILSVAVLLRVNYGWIIGFPASSGASRQVPYGVAIAAGGIFVATRLIAVAG